MVIETDRLIIRDIELPDGEAFIHMALDGSLNDVGFPLPLYPPKMDEVNELLR